MDFKILLRPFWNSNIIRLIRNELGIRSFRHVFPQALGLSFSDLHYWRVGQSFQTKYVMTDVVSEFLGIDSASYCLTFLDNNGKFLFKRQLEKCQGMIEVSIDSEFMGIDAGHGTYYLTTICSEVFDKSVPFSFKNRWYTGYKGARGPFSMVHGNTLVAWNSLDGGKSGMGITESTIFRRFSYSLQFDPSVYDRVDLVFVNPCSKKIEIYFNGSKIVLAPFAVAVAETDSGSMISYESTCAFLRPLVMGNKNEFIDCFHG